jgi:hypothetical protein
LAIVGHIIKDTPSGIMSEFETRHISLFSTTIVMQSLFFAQKAYISLCLIQANLCALFLLPLVFTPLIYPYYTLSNILSFKRCLVVIYSNFFLLIFPILHILLSFKRQKMQSKSSKPLTILFRSLYYLVPFIFTLKRQV